jgi:hypothetical protein
VRDHLVAARIAGDVATPRQSNVRNMRRLAEGDPDVWFGLTPRPLSFQDVLDVMHARAGTSPNAAHEAGADTIDPDKTIERLDAMAERLKKAARDREDVFVATGHPAGVLAIHLPVAQALREAGCRLLTPDAGADVSYQDRKRELRYLGGVGVVSLYGEVNHTHSPVPMRHLLDRGLRPGLVIADHGWAGAAGEAGIDTVAFADSNDPALFIGEADGRIGVCVPLDDNVLPHLYQPLADLLVGAIRPNGG